MGNQTSDAESAGRRLATQNLLLSAQRAADGFDTGPEAIGDIAAVIDAAVLHDTLVFLDPNNRWVDYAATSDFGSFLAEEVVAPTSPTDQQIALVTGEAAANLTLFLGAGKTDRYHEFVLQALSPNAARDGLDTVADKYEELKDGQELLRLVGDRNWKPEAILEPDARRGAVFLVRSFLYLAFASTLRRPLVPDKCRTKAYQRLSERHTDAMRSAAEQAGVEPNGAPSNSDGDPSQVRHGDVLREEVQRAIVESDPDEWVASGDTAFESPFASLVFARCGGDRARLGEETRRLRAEVAPSRERLAQLEQRAYLGATRDESQDARAELGRLLAELTRNFGPSGGRRVWPNMIDLRGAVAAIPSKPVDVAAWIKVVERALPFELIGQWWRRRPLVEIHDLRAQLPAGDQTAANLDALFGAGWRS